MDSQEFEDNSADIERAKTLIGKKVKKGNKVGTFEWSHETGGPPQLTGVTKDGQPYKPSKFFIGFDELGELEEVKDGGRRKTRRRHRRHRTRKA